MSQPYTPREICGAGFTTNIVARQVGGGAVLYVAENTKTKKLCATTIKFSNVGTPTRVGVALGKYHTDWSTARDWGTYSYYAGPVYSSDKCIWVAGTVGPNTWVFTSKTAWVWSAPICRS